jgi:hypothetical protein
MQFFLTIPGHTSGGGTHLYCPLHRSDGLSYDPLNLPLRTHNNTLKQGYKVLCAPNDTARANLATECGIKGVSLLARLPGISIPDSFPAEIMHMVWINLIPQLVDLWTQKFNGLDEGTEQYAVDPLLWNSLGDITDDSGTTIPSSFGCRIPHLNKRSQFTAESWLIWATQLAPLLLRRRFTKPKYYIHFVQLIKLMKEVTDHSIKKSEPPRLREGFAQWVMEYEK